MGKLKMIMLASVVLACSQMSWAEEKEKAIPIKEVVVTATRTEREIKDVPASVTVITKEDIEKTSARYLTDILRDVCGIDVYYPYGLSSTFPRISIRGIPHQRGNLILVDGMPLNDMWYGGVPFDEIPLENIERIEVVRGATSSLYGSSAMGGVINIITKEPEKEMRHSLEATFGTLKTWNSRATTSGTLRDKFGYFFSFNRLETDGYISTIEEYRQPYTTYRTRDHEDIYTKFTYDIDPTSNISLSYSHWHEKVGGGQINYGGSTERERPTLGYEKKTEKYNLSINTFFLDEDYYWNYISYVSPYPVQKRNHRDLVDAGAVVSFSIPLGERHTFTLGTDYRWARIDSKYDWFISPFRKTRTKGKQHRGSFFIQDEIKLLGEKLIIIPSARGDWYRTYSGSYYDTTKTPQEVVYNAKTSGAFNPKLGLVYHLTDSTTLYGSIGRSFNAPHLYNLYYQYGWGNKWWEGNAGLGPEYGIEGEWGIKQSFGENLDVKLLGFYNDINDWIGTVFVRQDGTLRIYQSQNISDIQTSGLELEAEYRPFPFLSFYANYNYTHSEIEKFPGKEELEGNWLENTPCHKANFGFTFDDPDIITFSIRQRWVGKRYGVYDTENKHALNKYITWDVEFSRNITKYVKASFEIDNITNRKWEEYYKDEVPGRMFFGRLKFTY